MGKKKGSTPPKIVPRRGPPSNLRPAGAHDDETAYDRKKEKAVLRRDLAEDGFPLESRAEARRSAAKAAEKPKEKEPDA